VVNAIELLEVYKNLNEPNRFAVLVYARMKVALQTAVLCKPYHRERKTQKVLQAHWLAGSGAG